MLNRSKILLAGASIAVLMAGGALAQDASQKANEAAANAEQAADSAGEALKDAAAATGAAAENAAEATADAADDAADATVDAANDATQATGEAIENAADATADAADDAVDATERAADNAADAARDTANDVAESAEEATDVDTAEMEPAEGTPLEGQIFVQSADTFLASVVMETTVVNAAGEEIGDVNDLVLTSDGQIGGVVIGVGGFLGVGEKDVALDMQRLEISIDPDGELVMVLNESEEALEAAPEFVTADERDEAAGMGTDATPAPATTQ